MTTEQLAALLDVSPHSVRAWVQRGKLPHRRHGRDLIFTAADVMAARAMQSATTRGRRSDLERPAGTAPLAAYVDVDQAAAILERSTRHVRRLVADGELQAWRTELSPTSLLRADVGALVAARERLAS